METARPEEDQDESSRRLPVLLTRARRLVSDWFRGTLRRHDLSEQQFRILRTLQFNDQIDVNELTRRADLTQSSVSRMLGSMQERGLILRIPDSKDARRTRVTLTPVGKQLVHATMLDVDVARVALEEKLGEDFVDRIRTVLVELIEQMEDGTKD